MLHHVERVDDSAQCATVSDRNVADLVLVHEFIDTAKRVPDVAGCDLARHQVPNRTVHHVAAKLLQAARDGARGDDALDLLAVTADHDRSNIVALELVHDLQNGRAAWRARLCPYV